MLGPSAWQRRSTWQAACAAVSGLTVGWLTWWYTAVGLFLTPDSGSYLGVVDNLGSGGGITSAIPPETASASLAYQAEVLGRFPLSEWPPLYPVAVWLAANGGSPVDAARWVNVLATAALALVIAWALVRLTDPHPAVLLVAPLAVLLAPVATTVVPLLAVDTVGQSGFLLSESLFLPCFLLALVVGCASARPPRRRWLAAAVVLVVAATMVRFAGMVAGVGAGIAVAAAGPRAGLRDRWPFAAALCAIGPASVVLWGVVQAVVWGGGDERVAWHPPGWQVARDHLDVVGGWFWIPGQWPVWLRVLLCAAVVIGASVIVVVPAVRRAVVGSALEPGEVAGTLALGLVGSFWAYAGLIVATQWLLDANVAANQRLLSPAQLLMWLLLFALVMLTTRRVADGVGLVAPRNAWSASAAGLLLALLVVVGSLASIGDRRDLLAAAVRGQAESIDSSVLGDIPDDVLLIANFTGKAYLESGRPVLLLPSPTDLVTGSSNTEFRSEMRELGRLLERERGVVVVTPGFAPVDPELAEGLEQDAGLTLVRTCESGDLLYARPATAASLDPIRC
jgi:hypothetical protein